MPTFSHLHNHTQFSLLDGASDIKKMLKKAKEDGQPAMAITDHGNMFGVFDFVAKAADIGVKPIVGCEFYLVEDHTRKQFTKDNKDVRYHQLLLAKNMLGYHNLAKLCSMGYIDGLYGKYPRISKKLIEDNCSGLIATTCCLGAIVPKTIMRKGEEAGEAEFKYWLDMFGRENYFIELQRHGIADQDRVNEVLLKFAKKYDVNVIASNDSHYVDQEDWVAHDILLCVNTGEKMSTPKMSDFSDDDVMPKGTRFAFSNDQFFLKTTEQMATLFKDIPQAIDNTNIIVDMVEPISLKKDILLPNFPIPAEYKIHEEDTENQWEYLKHLTFQGAHERYGELTSEVEERLNFELNVIKNMGFAGYFLIVADFIKEARNLDVMVGPGRGSAAGSAVAYCIKITNIDPIKYGLLFERFLNPDRKSMPDIDTDFDDEGRQKVIEYVCDKYGRNQVAQIITYGTMASKSAIKDVARVMDLPLAESNALAKMIPDKQTYSMNLTKAFKSPLGNEEDSLAHIIAPEEIENLKKLRLLEKGNDLTADVLKQAQKLEGTVRNTGIHAAGVIIAPKDLKEILPVCTAKDSDMLVTQFEGNIIEDAGVIKMDFLGLKNLTIIKDCLALVKENFGVVIDIDNIPLDDPKPYEIFQKGETNGIFQFESDGMKKHLKDLVPDRLEDLIAMNALYRPGPIKYIPNFVRRKHGQEEVVFDLPEMEPFLSDTFGITVYQEQVMRLSRKLANFTPGEADTLRKAMGKKDRKTLDKMKGKFLEEGGTTNGHDAKILEKIWADWEDFASYAFNKSHSTCYAFVAYQTAYLKAHYPAEYMAALLTNSLGSIEKITFFLQECKAMNLVVLGPDVNESSRKFSVNKRQEIRFGLGGIKGAGDAAVESIISERKLNGPYTDIYDFMTRVNLRTVNKKTMEALAYAGAFDGFEELHRAQYFDYPDGNMGIEMLIKYANAYHDDKKRAQSSLFGESTAGAIAKPKFPNVEPWGEIQKLQYEKDVVGLFLSGHPLDEFKPEMAATVPLTEVLELHNRHRELRLAGIVTSCQQRIAKNGNPWSIVKIDDLSGSFEITLFGKDHLNFGHFFQVNNFLFIKGKMQQRWNQEDNFEFKIGEVNLLPDYRKTLYKSVKLKLDLENLNNDLIEYLESQILTENGYLSLHISLVDRENGLELPLVSRDKKVNLTNEVYEFLINTDQIIDIKLS